MDPTSKLPVAQKRSDKISKNDERFLYKMKKNKRKATAREGAEREMREEEALQDEQTRLSTGKPTKKHKQQTYNVKVTKKKTTKKNVSLGMQLVERSQEVLDGTIVTPCILDKVMIVEPHDDDNLGDDDHITGTNQDRQESLTEMEISQNFPGDIIWKDLDYPHIIPHDKLWVFCSYCHLGLPSTSVKYFIASPVKVQVGHSGVDKFNCAAINKWLLYHDNCYIQATRGNAHNFSLYDNRVYRQIHLIDKEDE